MSVHIQAQKGEIAENVLLPGDPLRAKWIAENFLEDAVCYNKVRGMLGYTGTYKGNKVSVQATGMGIPSALIYATELITEFGAKKLIRVGSAGSYQKDLKVNDVVLAMAASSNSGFNKAKFQHADFAPTVDFELFMNAVKFAKTNDIPFRAGNVLSSDIFYEENDLGYKKWADYGVLCVEMETAGLYTVAAKYNVQALSVLTVSDSLVTGEHLPAKEREQSFSRMVEIALGSI
ncbi:purine-nucleoside phosphorylase [Salegentibacter mishustinae]|uniref:Uridine phosphorylase n=1 Tax=Salegentibacter mishustinae TaxID=270918 RepID=A0A0Q9ZGN7_9FLAO|nr:purine-nucleoside phosphorylase [Salegentibacter mishustinae]KRG27203.1 purine nucleoside phosphorylase DeoD-type [Salegentibacter mishustinae]PNW21437.1 purine nucleoside phosphorylase DeoD-type [Salegentibacter mishustinae]PZX62614.1 purine-nucleoside phosphorylase [Salegentibacter mishustinae]GGW97080.1 purine-nucleoside phosphorylase [Salegentibacter mishustinae]